MRVGAKRRHGSDATDLVGDCEPSGESGVANCDTTCGARAGKAHPAAARCETEGSGEEAVTGVLLAREIERAPGPYENLRGSVDVLDG